VTAAARLDLASIEAALRQLQQVARADNRQWQGLRREPLGLDALSRFVEGYRQIDALLAADIEVFDYGNSKQLLELNHIVLCGRSAATRAAAAKHLEDTEAAFYRNGPGGIGSLSEWYARHRKEELARLIAGIFVRMVSEPQLFIEGNQRTATLVCSYLLARRGYPPVVVTKDNYLPCFELFQEIKSFDRRSFLRTFREYRYCGRLRRLYLDHADRSFLKSTIAAR